MNQQNSEGFTPLLYACYNGHMDIMRYLVEQYGVNGALTTKTGLNPLHLAAQKDIVLPIIYFKQHIDLNSKDQLNSSSLHWAAYMNCEKVVAYLLSEDRLTCLDDRDSEGNTALMLSVMYGNTRVVRRLLIAGADRSLPNQQGQMPMEVALENNFQTIARMLNEDYGCCDMVRFYCNVKMEYRPKYRNLTIPTVFLLTLVFNLAVLHLNINFNEWYLIYSEIVALLTMSLLYFTLLKGPSPPDHREEDESFLDKNERVLKKICFQCRTLTPKRGYHCDICHTCIPQYDHHCTWINNCVGKRNIGRFIFFLIFLILSLAFIGALSVLGQLCLIMDNPRLYVDWFQLRLQYESTGERAALMVVLAVNLVTSLFILPVLMLFVVQVKNLLKNKTTYEFMRSPTEAEGLIKSKMKTARSRMSLGNCLVMCSDNPTYQGASLSTSDLIDEPLSPSRPPSRLISSRM